MTPTPQTPMQLSAEQLRERTPAQLINQTSGDVEYYTPDFIIRAARVTMGDIHLDPASSAIANKRVCACQFIDEANDGLRAGWLGNVWMNHPFGRTTNGPWIRKLISEHKAGRTIQACCITFACTSEQWFQPLMDYPQCYLSPRTNYYLPDGTLKRGVTKGSVVTYLGDVPCRFKETFKPFGKVMFPA